MPVFMPWAPTGLWTWAASPARNARPLAYRIARGDEVGTQTPRPGRAASAARRSRRRPAATHRAAPRRRPRRRGWRAHGDDPAMARDAAAGRTAPAHRPRGTRSRCRFEPSTSRSASRKVFGYRAPTNAIPSAARTKLFMPSQPARCRARRCSSSPFAWRSEQATSASDCWYLTSSTPRSMDTPPLVCIAGHGLGLRLRHEQQEGERRVIDADIEQPRLGGSAAAVQPNLDRKVARLGGSAHPPDRGTAGPPACAVTRPAPRDSNDRSTARSTRRTESPQWSSCAARASPVGPAPTTRTSHEPPLPATTQSPRRDALPNRSPSCSPGKADVSGSSMDVIARSFAATRNLIERHPSRNTGIQRLGRRVDRDTDDQVARPGHQPRQALVF